MAVIVDYLQHNNAMNMKVIKRFIQSSCLMIVYLLLLLQPLLYAREAKVDPMTGEVNTGGEIVVDPELVLKLMQASGAFDGFGGIPEQTAIDVAAVIQKASIDPETSLLLLRMKKEQDYNAFKNDDGMMTEDQIVSGLAEVIFEMNALETLYREYGPDRAYEELLKEGMIPKNRIKEYKNNPSLLETDKLKSLYFTFITLAAAGGYL